MTGRLRRLLRGADLFVDGRVSRQEASGGHCEVQDLAGRKDRAFEVCRVLLRVLGEVNLDTLMQTVREKTDMLIVTESEFVWWRPWVIGEIAQASMAQVPILFAVPRTDAQAAEADNTVPPINFDAINEALPDKSHSERSEGRRRERWREVCSDLLFTARCRSCLFRVVC